MGLSVDSIHSYSIHQSRRVFGAEAPESSPSNCLKNYPGLITVSLKGACQAFKLTHSPVPSSFILTLDRVQVVESFECSHWMWDATRSDKITSLSGTPLRSTSAKEQLGLETGNFDKNVQAWLHCDKVNHHLIRMQCWFSLSPYVFPPYCFRG